MQNSSVPYSAVIDTPIHKVGIKIHDEKLRHIEFLRDVPVQAAKDRFTQKVIKQLEAYFADPSFSFDLPYEVCGTAFQEKVWRALTKIPLGKTLSYGDLAKKLQSSPRAIGNACRTNPIAIVIPCHRIVAKNGLGGFNGATKGHPLQIKTWLLEHESSEKY